MKNLCKFRCRSHHLPVNNGRFIEVTQADLKCTLCKSGEVGDEYHYSRVYTTIVVTRVKYNPGYFNPRYICVAATHDIPRQ